MNPRPIYRWKSFWLGVMVLFFLGWAWVRSMHFIDVVHYESRAGDRSMSLGHGWGRLSFTWRAYSTGRREFMYETIPLREPAPRWFQEWLMIQVSTWQRGLQRNGSIADWFLILLFLVSWVSLLGWRWRRMGRLVVGSVERVGGDGV